MIFGSILALESDFFYMVNSMNVRHNNCDAADKKKYNAKFVTLTSQEQEDWYDEIYQEGLMAFLNVRTGKSRKKNCCVQKCHYTIDIWIILYI